MQRDDSPKILFRKRHKDDDARAMAAIEPKTYTTPRDVIDSDIEQINRKALDSNADPSEDIRVNGIEMPQLNTTQHVRKCSLATR